MKTIFIILGICLLLAIATYTGEAMFGKGVEADMIRSLLRGRV